MSIKDVMKTVSVVTVLLLDSYHDFAIKYIEKDNFFLENLIGFCDMKKANDILLKVLGVLLLTAAAMKGWQLLTEPIANNDIWTNRAFLIFTVEFELALGVWLLSGILKKLSWLATLACFSMFSVITFYKGLSGAESCGCFGSVHVNPWITLFAIDIPAIMALAMFRHKLSFFSKGISIRNFVKEMFTPLPSMPRISTIFGIGIMLLFTTAMVLAFNKPAKSTSTYEILEPNDWLDKELAIIDYIDIGKQLEKGNWLVLFYHYDCPDCINAIKKLNKTKYEIQDARYELNIAIIEVPPYGSPIEINCLYGRLLDVKEWFIATPQWFCLKIAKLRKLGNRNCQIGAVFLIIYTQKQKENLCSLKGGDAWQKVE